MLRQSVLVSAVVLVGCGVLAAAEQTQLQMTEKVIVPVLGYDGQDQFATYCASCHGPTAKGDGPVGASFRRRPADLTLIASRNGGRFDAEMVHRIIDGRQPVKGHGGGDMPVWGDAFSRSRDGATPEAVKDRIDSIVRWLSRIQRTNVP